MNFPKHIKLGSKKWKVKLVAKKDLTKDWRSRLVIGDSNEHVIRVWRRLSTADKWLILVHEILHVCWIEAGLERNEFEERAVDSMDKILYRILKENFGVGES